MLELLKELCIAPGVSGDEGGVRELIRSHAQKHADEIFRDTLGNLIVTKRGAHRSNRKTMLCAHMDEVGIIVTGITDDGYLKFSAAGSIDRRVLAGKRVYFGRVTGIIGCSAIHLLKGDDRENIPKTEDMYIDIGVNSAKSAAEVVEIGDTGAFDNEVLLFGDGFIRAKALDDRIGCTVMLKLLESELPVDVTFAFTVQEEVGARGAGTAAFSVAPDISLILEATTAADMPDISGGKRVCELGSGGVIPFMDGGTVYDRELFDMLTQAADREGIMWQTKKYISGGTDAQAVQRSRNGVQTLAISAPVRNLHSPACVGKLADIEGVFTLARLFLSEIGARHGV